MYNVLRLLMYICKNKGYNVKIEYKFLLGQSLLLFYFI